MSEVREHSAQLLRAYQAQERRFVERRFPLEFTPEVPALRELYNQSKGLHWNPETDIPWDRLDPARYDRTTREAVSRTWSRRAWSIYPGLTESTALLIRFCLESGSLGMDAKLFLSFRPAEEAKHLEVCHMLAERFGGYTADPGEPSLARTTSSFACCRWLTCRLRSSWSSNAPSAATYASTGTSPSSAAWPKG